MKHLVLSVSDGFIHYRMGVSIGYHPLSEDDVIDTMITYIVSLINPITYEIKPYK